MVVLVVSVVLVMTRRRTRWRGLGSPVALAAMVVLVVSGVVVR